MSATKVGTRFASPASISTLVGIAMMLGVVMAVFGYSVVFVRVEHFVNFLPYLDALFADQLGVRDREIEDAVVGLGELDARLLHEQAELIKRHVERLAHVTGA